MVNSSRKDEVEAYANSLADRLRLEVLKARDTSALHITPEALVASHARAIDDAVNFANKWLGTARVARCTSDRATRTVEVEIASLWKMAFASYGNFRVSTAPERIKEVLTQNAEYVQVYKNEAIEFLKSNVLPILAGIPNPGDATFWGALELINGLPSPVVSDAIAHQKPTPANSYSLYYALFGLLVQAEKYLKQGDVIEAYSCLLDAQRALGLAAGARSITRHVAESSVTRVSVVNANTRWGKFDDDLLLLAELYYSLQVSRDGTAKPWASAEMAAYAIQDAVMEKLELTEPPEKDTFKFENILKHARRLFNLEAQGFSLNIRGMAVPADSSEG